jgi:hypothetical protein
MTLKQITSAFLLLLLLNISACRDDLPAATGIVAYKFMIEKFPEFKPNGDTWDTQYFTDESSADLELHLKKGNVLLWKSAVQYNNAVSPEYYELVAYLAPIFVPAEDNTFNLILLDNDAPNTPDTLGNITFNPFEKTEELPESFFVRDGNVTVETFVSYLFE